MRNYTNKPAPVGLAGAIAAVVLGIALMASKSQTVLLPGGVELSLIGMTCGPTNVCYPGGALDKLVYRFGPVGGFHVGRFKFVPASPITNCWHYSDGRVAQPNSGVVWLRHHGGTNTSPLPMPEGKWFFDLRAEIVDDAKGERWEMRPGSALLYPGPGRGWDGVTSWRFSAFPRRAEKFTFNIYGRIQDQWNLLAAFRVPNPAPGPYAVWKPMRLPATQTNGNLTVSLVSLVTGTKIVHYLPKEKRPFTTATFKVMENGQVSDRWVPDQMEATDATGNEMVFQIVDYGATNGLAFYHGQSTSLAPSEVWRLRMRFAPQKDYPPDQLWTSPSLPVANGIISPINLTTNFRNYSVTIECSLNTRRALRLTVDPVPNNGRLTLVGIVDDEGRTVERRVVDRRNGNPGDNYFEPYLKLRPEPESIRVTIALPEIRSFTFYARPVGQDHADAQEQLRAFQ